MRVTFIVGALFTATFGDNVALACAGNFRRQTAQGPVSVWQSTNVEDFVYSLPPFPARSANGAAFRSQQEEAEGDEPATQGVASSGAAATSSRGGMSRDEPDTVTLDTIDATTELTPSLLEHLADDVWESFLEAKMMLEATEELPEEKRAELSQTIAAALFETSDMSARLTEMLAEDRESEEESASSGSTGDEGVLRGYADDLKQWKAINGAIREDLGAYSSSRGSMTGGAGPDATRDGRSPPSDTTDTSRLTGPSSERPGSRVVDGEVPPLLERTTPTQDRDTASADADDELEEAERQADPHRYARPPEPPLGRGGQWIELNEEQGSHEQIDLDAHAEAAAPAPHDGDDTSTWPSDEALSQDPLTWENKEGEEEEDEEYALPPAVPGSGILSASGLDPQDPAESALLHMGAEGEEMPTPPVDQLDDELLGDDSTPVTPLQDDSFIEISDDSMASGGQSPFNPAASGSENPGISTQFGENASDASVLHSTRSPTTSESTISEETTHAGTDTNGHGEARTPQHGDHVAASRSKSGAVSQSSVLISLCTIFICILSTL